MSLRAPLLPLARTLVPARPAPSSSPLLALRRAFHPQQGKAVFPRRAPPAGSLVATRVAARQQGAWASRMASVGLGVAAGYGVWSAIGSSPFRGAECESLAARPQVPADQPPPESIFSLYELSFGAACGICTGVFIKKGLRAIAFLLGGIFVLMQYMSSKSLINVNWGNVSSKYDSVFGTKTAAGESRAPTVRGVYNWFVDFITANFQQRASFLAGMALGFRLG